MYALVLFLKDKVQLITTSDLVMFLTHTDTEIQTQSEILCMSLLFHFPSPRLLPARCATSRRLAAVVAAAAAALEQAAGIASPLLNGQLARYHTPRPRLISLAIRLLVEPALPLPL